MYDIHQVCQMLGTTSRTLRYYEEKGLITCERESQSSRRCFTMEQTECVRNILTLRTLGLSLKSIAALQTHDTTLKEAVLLRRAEIEACTQQKLHELSRLNEALLQLETDGTLVSKPRVTYTKDVNGIVKQCCEAMVKKDIKTLYSYFTPKLTAYLPETVFCTIWQDVVSPLGEFCIYEKLWYDDVLPNTVYQLLRFDNLRLCVKLVFCEEQIDGIWLNYYDEEE